jgi:hypothetical protein
MARLPRVVVVDVAHHVTQRGNARQVVFENDADRFPYLELLRQYSELHALSLAARKGGRPKKPSTDPRQMDLQVLTTSLCTRA